MTAIARAVLVLALLVSFQLPATARRNPFESIRPFQVMMDDGKLHPVCTAFPVRLNDRTVWLTAYHCVAEPPAWVMNPDAEWYIDGKKSVVIQYAFDTKNGMDFAILTSGASAQPLSLGYSTPPAGSFIQTAGYPHGSARQHVVSGVVSLTLEEDGATIWSLPGAPGMSGGPILDKDGLVVGTMTQIECPFSTWCPVSRGTRVETLREFLYGE